MGLERPQDLDQRTLILVPAFVNRGGQFLAFCHNESPCPDRRASVNTSEAQFSWMCGRTVDTNGWLEASPLHGLVMRRSVRLAASFGRYTGIGISTGSESVKRI